MEVQLVITSLLSVLGNCLADLSQLNLNPNPQLVSILIKDLLKSLEEILHQLDHQFLSSDTNKDSCLHASPVPITINKVQPNFDHPSSSTGGYDMAQNSLTNSNLSKSMVGTSNFYYPYEIFDHPSSSTGGYDMAQNSLTNSNLSKSMGETRFPVRSHHVQTNTQSDKGKGFGREFSFHGNASCSESDMSSHTYTFNHGSCSASMPDCDDTMGYDSETVGNLLWPMDGEDTNLALQEFSPSLYWDDVLRQVENFSNHHMQMQQLPSSTEQATPNSTKSNLALASNVNDPTTTAATTTTTNSTKSNLALASNVNDPTTNTTAAAATTTTTTTTNSTESNLALASNVNDPTTTTTTTTHNNASSALLEWILKSNHLRSDTLPILKEDLENVLYPRLSEHDRKKLLEFRVLNFEYEVDPTHRYSGYIERQPQGRGKIHLTRLRNFYRKVKAERQDKLALFMSSSDPLFLKLRFDKVPKQKKKLHDSIPSLNAEFPDSTWCIDS